MKPKRNRKAANKKTASTLAVILLLATIASSSITFVFLPFSSERYTFTVSCLIVGSIITVLSYAAVIKMPDQLWARIVACSLVALTLAVPLASAIFPRVTYSRFGFTVYGATPIPVLDITINRQGVLWFRPKTHQITRAELDALIGADVEIVVVGIGWDSIAQLTDNARQLSDSIDLRVLPTPNALALYNKLKAEGRSVVLLAHTTC